jgi:hypothetical protein
MKLQPRHRRAIAALLAGTVEDAARTVGVTERTIYNWLNDSEFAAALAAAETDALANAARLMAGGAEKAIAALTDVIDNAIDNREKIAAARAFLSSLPNVRLLGSIEAKLAKLLGEDSDSENVEAG